MIVTNKKISLIFVLALALTGIVHGATWHYSGVESQEWQPETFAITLTLSDENPFLNQVVYYSGTVTINGELVEDENVTLFESTNDADYVGVGWDLTDTNGLYNISYSRTSVEGTYYYKAGFEA